MDPFDNISFFGTLSTFCQNPGWLVRFSDKALQLRSTHYHITELGEVDITNTPIPCWELALRIVGLVIATLLVVPIIVIVTTKLIHRKVVYGLCRTLIAAQENVKVTAEKLLKDGQDHIEALTREAKESAAELTQKAKKHADTITGDAKINADRMAYEMSGANNVASLEREKLAKEAEKQLKEAQAKARDITVEAELKGVIVVEGARAEAAKLQSEAEKKLSEAHKSALMMTTAAEVTASKILEGEKEAEKQLKEAQEKARQIAVEAELMGGIVVEGARAEAAKLQSEAEKKLSEAHNSARMMTTAAELTASKILEGEEGLHCWYSAQWTAAPTKIEGSTSSKKTWNLTRSIHARPYTPSIKGERHVRVKLADGSIRSIPESICQSTPNLKAVIDFKRAGSSIRLVADKIAAKQEDTKREAEGKVEKAKEPKSLDDEDISSVATKTVTTDLEVEFIPMKPYIRQIRSSSSSLSSIESENKGKVEEEVLTQQPFPAETTELYFHLLLGASEIKDVSIERLLELYSLSKYLLDEKMQRLCIECLKGLANSDPCGLLNMICMYLEDYYPAYPELLSTMISFPPQSLHAILQESSMEFATKHFAEWIIKKQAEIESAGKTELWLAECCAVFYKCGLGVEKDVKKSAEYYDKIFPEDLDKIDPANLAPWDAYLIGVCPSFSISEEIRKLMSRNLEKTAQTRLCFYNAADKGFARAQYEWSKLLDEYSEKRLSYLEKAARQGHPIAQHDLGVYYLGHFFRSAIDLEKQKGMMYLNLSAGQGYAKGHYQLGRAFAVNRDLIKALKHYEKAHQIDPTLPEVLIMLGHFSRRGLGHTIEETIAQHIRAFGYYLQAAELGNAEAPKWLGLCYLLGRGVVRDFAQAQTQFTLALSQLVAVPMHWTEFAHRGFVPSDQTIHDMDASSQFW